MAISRCLIIAGDAQQDLFAFPSMEQAKSEQVVWSRGGAGLLSHFLEGVAKSSSNVEVHTPSFREWQSQPSSLIELNAHTTDNDSAPPRFALKQKRHFQDDLRWHLPEILSRQNLKDVFSIVVFQDGKTRSEEEDEKAISLLLEPELPNYFIYHMVRPLCQGKVWERVRPDARNMERGFHPKQLFVIVHADDLRSEGVQLSYGLSWERTCEDFVRHLGSVSWLTTLAMCQNLIVVFGCDAIIYHRGLQAERPVLFFDAGRSEGQFYRENMSDIPGAMEAFVAGFAKAVIEQDKLDDDIDIDLAILKAFRAARRLGRQGVALPLKGSSIYDTQAIIEPVGEDSADVLTRFNIPSDDIGANDENSWSLLDYLIGDTAEVARHIVIEGADSAGVQVPSARFKNLVLFDRTEIELFRSLFNIIQEYLAVQQTKPLNMAFFGPPGSGKSFAAMQVAEEALSSRRIRARKLRFDLSQFNELKDLTRALYQIRDATLEGCMPLVYLNNFDAHFNGIQLSWLPYLLPAMAGGFSDEGIVRPTGPAILFFGATNTKTYKHFERHAASTRFANSAREFLGCLQGFANIIGFNSQQGVADRLYPVRRAVVLRHLILKRAPKMRSQKILNIDKDVLNALLIVPEYRQGIRSLQSILAMSRLNDEEFFRLSALPPREQLEPHIHYEDFISSIVGFPLPKEIREAVAEQLNLVYNNHMRATDPNTYRNVKSWENLDENYKESNREHADTIPYKLGLINCFLSTKSGHEKVNDFSIEEVEIMSISEKARWNSERLQKQWRNGPRDVGKLTSPFLEPWESIGETAKEIDRALVRSYPKIIPDNYAIYRMRSIGLH